MIKQMDTECTSMQMAQNTKENGKTTSSMVLEKNSGKMAVSTQASMLIQRKKEEEAMFGQMVTNILEIGRITPFMVQAYTNGRMAEFTAESGKTT